MEDYLREVSEESLAQLAELYKLNMIRFPHIYSFIQTVIKWSQYTETKPLMKIYRPINSTATDGTFILIINFACYEIIMNTLLPDRSVLYHCLMATKIINFQRPVRFTCVELSDYWFILELVKMRRLKIVSNVACDLYWISRENARKFILTPEPDVYIKWFDQSDIRAILSPTDRNYNNYLSTIIKLNGGCGVFSCSNDALLTWTSKPSEGQLGLLQVVDEAARFTSNPVQLIMEVSLQIAECGYNPFVFVKVDNLFTQNWFKMLRFCTLGYYLFITVNS